MFKEKAIAMFNNTMFTFSTIDSMSEPIHASVERLYLAAREIRAVTGQSAVARLLDQTPQTVKNWEKRGISEGGALIAQRRIGCDANWLLDGRGAMTLTDAWTGATAAMATEPDRSIYALPIAWPFKTVTRSQYDSLTAEQKAHVEAGIRMLLQIAGPDEKQYTPEKDAAA